MRGPQYRPQYTIVLIIGTPKTVPLILGNCTVLEKVLLGGGAELQYHSTTKGFSVKAMLHTSPRDPNSPM